MKLAERKLAMSEVLRLGVGSIIEFVKSNDEPLQLMINNRTVAIGEAARDLVGRHGPFAGIRIAAPVGTRVRAGDPLAYIAGAADEAARVAGAFGVGPEPPAERSLIEGGMRRDKRRLSVDRVAATLMLQAHLDRRRAG